MLSQCSRNRTAIARSAGATVELALALPFLVFLFLITIDYGRIFYYSLIIENCARNGALFSTHPFLSPYSDLNSAVLADAGDLSPAPTYTLATGNDANDSNNPYAEVTVSWTFNTVTQFPFWSFPNSVDLQRTVRMRTAPP